MKPYNGHKSWDYWNVSLWIGNDEGLYNFAKDCVRQHGRRQGAKEMLEFLHEQGITSTPDGAKYNISRIYAAMEGMRDGR